MNYKYLFIGWLSLISVIFAVSQPLSIPPGARAAGMGGCGIVNKDMWGFWHNQAVLAYQSGLEFGLALENRFLLEEMNRISLATAIKVGKGGLSASLDYFGGPLYSEMKSGAAYALQIGSHFAVGIQLDYLRTSFGEGYGSMQAFTFEGGVLAQISEKFSLGFHCFNPVHVSWIGTSEKIPVVIGGGISFKPEASITIYGEIMKSTVNAGVFSAGCEYRFKNKFFMRAGVSSGPASLSFGAGIKLKKLSIDIASGLHSYLGYSPQISLSYSSK